MWSDCQGESRMSVTRLINTYCQRPIRDKLPQVIFIVTVFMTVIWLWKGMSGKKLEFFCSSERNLRQSETFKKIGLNLIPSVPQKREPLVESQKDGDNYTQGLIDPYENQCLDIALPGGSEKYMICIHDPYRDLIVSAHLKEEGQWEKENVEALQEAHRRFPDMTLVDLGCNIGAFTLPAAKMGMEVLAVDAMLDSLRLLQRSLLINCLACHVTLVHNAVYRRRAKMRLIVDPTNVGGARVMELKSKQKNVKVQSQLVDAICLDDLVPLLRGKTVFLKIDLEGSEAYSLACAEEFFRQVNVKVLLLGWAYLRHRDKEGLFVKNFLSSENMAPTWGLDSDRVIDLYASHAWPDHVFWMRRH